jgi:HEAT repeat protein
MNTENPVSKNFYKMLLSSDPVQKTEALFNLTSEIVDDDTIKSITRFFLIDDKSIRNAVSNFLIQNSNPIIPFSVIEYVSFPDISVRNIAGEILRKKGVESLGAICEKLQRLETDDDIKFLIDILGIIGDKSPEDLIIDFLKKSRNENVIVACIEALGSIRSEKAIDIIIPYYERAEELQPVVIEAVGKIPSKRSLEFIIDKFKTNDGLLKFIMIESMGEIGDVETFYFLLSQMGSLSGTLIWPLLESIYKLKLKYNLDVPYDEKIKQCILETIQNAEPFYQIIAAHLVTIYDDPDTLVACLNIFGIDDELNEVLHKKFMKNKKIILKEIHNVINNANRYLPADLELLQNIIRYDAGQLENLSRIEKRKLTDSLTNCLTNPDEILRITAAELLFSIDQETALLFLYTMINDENIWNRARILDLLADLDDPIVSEALEILLNDPEEMISEKAKEIALRKQCFTN